MTGAAVFLLLLEAILSRQYAVTLSQPVVRKTMDTKQTTNMFSPNYNFLWVKLQSAEYDRVMIYLFQQVLSSDCMTDYDLLDCLI